MNGIYPLTTLCFASFFSQFLISTGFVTIFPVWQSVKESDNVVIDCFDEKGGKVFWKRVGLPLPKKATQFRGRLTLNKIEIEDGGYYTCFGEDTESEESAYVLVYRQITNHSLVTSTTPRYSHQELAFTTSSFGFANTPYPCLYGRCNGTCCSGPATDGFFDCANGQKINKTLVCNRENDCDDGSDEALCAPWPPKMTVLPKHKVEVFCGDQDQKKAGTLILECSSVGHPVPLIRWKKYEGHVPLKCQQYSKRGHGILTCPNFQQSDQGAYSCVAENSVKVAESQPKTIVKCSNTINCNGFRVVNDEKIEHCLECFCSGRTTSCQSIRSNLTVIKIPFPETKNEIIVSENGKVLFVPTKTDLTPSNLVRKSSSQELTYCSLTESDLKDKCLLKSFGRNIIIPRYNEKIVFQPKAPSLIIQGNGLSLLYTANLIPPPKDSKMGMTIRFWPGNWHHINQEAASRIDLMKVLSNVDNIFIRCEYQAGVTVNWNRNSTILIESSSITNFSNSVSYVEKCHCPAGYDGLSCETCAEGYKKKPQGNSFVCEQIYVPRPCEPGYIGQNCTLCDTANGYQKNGNVCVKSVCNPAGSVSPFPEGLFGACNCKEGVTGKYCDQCKAGYFHLSNPKGCLKCWCSGVTSQCKSSKLYRTVISNIPSGGYNYSDGRNFWLLPSDFSGNQLTSYGGFLNYTMTYKPNLQKQKTILTVELLSMEDVTLSFAHTTIDNSLRATEKSWSVPLVEDGWKKLNKTSVSRGEFLRVLSKLKAVYIESPYHLSSYQVNLTSSVMSSASTYGDKQQALEVEECACPRGYTGRSCENCAENYYKKRNGTMTMCLKCNCTNCDPDFGCQGCPQLTYRDNPDTEKVPVCKPCPCKKNALSCSKDDFNQIFCRCKPGFTGMHCDEKIPESVDELVVRISPRRIKGEKAGKKIIFNCTAITDEEMVVTAKKNHGTLPISSLKKQGKETSTTFEVTLDNELKTIECFVHDAQGNVAAHAVATVDLIKVFEPVEIKNCYSDKVYVKESQSNDLICEATGSPTPMVNWYRSINGSKPEKVDTSGGVHSIESAPLNLNGSVYTCIAENSRGDKATCTKTLFVEKKCQVVNIIPNKVVAEEGKNISLTCKTTAKSPVIWEKLTSFGGKTSLFSFNTKVKDGFLHITSATASDSGTYICSATGDTGKINKTVSVIVKEKTEFPSVSIKEYDKTLKVGESFEIHCIVKGKPVPTVTWKKLNGRIEGNVHSYGKTLKITKAKIENAGIYVCEASSSLGNASSYISVEVKYDAIPPKVNISEETITAYEGDVVNVTCLSIGYPRPRLNWYAPNISISNLRSTNDSMVLIEPNESEKQDISFKISKEMNGLRIICIAENEAGRKEVEAKINILQRKTGDNETVEFVPIGAHFELVCELSGNLTWEKQGGKLVGDECPIPNGLVITSVQIQHKGTYICKSESASKKINVVVVGFVPKFSKISKSYLVLPSWSNKTTGNRIELSFRAASEDGLLLQKENKLDIYLQRKKIHFRLFIAENDYLVIEMKEPIELWKWYSLVVSIESLFDVTIYNEVMSIHERKTERLPDFKIGQGQSKSSFFVGGPRPQGSHSGKILPRHSSHFDGCISRLSIDSHEFDIVKEGSFSHNVTLCRRCSEYMNPCGEDGHCVDAPTQYGFICVCRQDTRRKSGTCPKSCIGKGCETQFDLCALLKPCKINFLGSCENFPDRLNCVCPRGYAGTLCEKAQEYSFCSKGNGYVKLPGKLLTRGPGIPEEIKIRFTLHKLDGQLLWQGDNANHLSISVHQGKLKYVYFNQQSRLEILGGKLETNVKYLLFSRRLNNSAFLEISSRPGMQTEDKYRNSTSKILTNRVNGDIYLGIVPNNTIFLNYNVGLNGCIHYVAFGEKAKINLLEEALERVSVSSFSSSALSLASSSLFEYPFADGFTEDDFHEGDY